MTIDLALLCQILGKDNELCGKGGLLVGQEARELLLATFYLGDGPPSRA